MSDHEEIAAITAAIDHMLTHDDHLIGPNCMLVVVSGILVVATIWAVRRLAPSFTKVAKTTEDEEGIWIPSPSFVNHMVVGAVRREEPAHEIEKIDEIVEELVDAMEELTESRETAVEESSRSDEESIDSIAKEIMETVRGPEEGEQETLLIIEKMGDTPKQESLHSSPGEPIANSTPTKVTAADEMKGKVKRETTIIKMTKKLLPRK